MIHPASVLSPNFHRFLILGGVLALAAACDPNVIIGAKWRVEEAVPDAHAGSESQGGSGGLSGSGGTTSGGGGAEAVVAGAAPAGDGGTPSAGGAPPSEPEWCATAPWVDEPVQFTSDDGNMIPSGSYLITYVSGAQIHDLDIGYEVTDYYFGDGGLEAGHHVFSGDSPEAGATSLWLDETGIVIVGSGGTIAEVEAANRGHTWPLLHAGGELYVTLYDDEYRDNSGPGTRFCVTAAPP